MIVSGEPFAMSSHLPTTALIMSKPLSPTAIVDAVRSMLAVPLDEPAEHRISAGCQPIVDVRPDAEMVSAAR